jgi:uncharacterized protein
MDLLPKTAPGRQIIEAYGDGGFRVNGQRWTQPLIVQPLLCSPWPATDLASAVIESLAPLFGMEPAVELLLIGCGPSMLRVPPALRAALKERGIMAEGMDTGAACRTYNVLMLEGRRVAAALLPV